MKLALLFDHFGPYHLARLGGAAACMDTLGVEFRGRSLEYSWDVADRGGSRVVTLVADTAGESEVAGQLRERLEKALEDFRPDVVAVPGWSSKGALAALKWCLARKVPAVLMTESSSHDEKRQFLKEFVKRRLVRLFSAYLAGGTSHVAYLKELGAAADRTFLGYDVIDNQYFQAGAERVHAADGEAPRRPSFLASARFIQKKNLPRLLQAYADYRTQAKAAGLEFWSLTLLGDGELRAMLESVVSGLDLAGDVSLPGFKQYEDLPAYYARASAFIHASTTEQWGLVVNEAMASGLPVLVSRTCGCAPDLVKDGINGHTFDPYDTAAMSDAMLRLTRLSRPELESMGSASIKIIAEWGPARFGGGLHDAAVAALNHGRPRVTWIDSAILALLARS